MTSNIEKRYSFSNKDNSLFKTRVLTESGNTESRKIKGYGIVFNQRSKIITEYIPEKNEYRTFWEVIDSHSLDDILNNVNQYDIILNVNHRFDEILARTTSGTLTIQKDEKGATYQTELPLTSRGEDVYQMTLRGDYFESSFQFIVAEGGDKWELDTATGIYVRTIMKIERLIDMCIATYRGAYDNTDIIVNDERIYNETDISVAKRKLDELLIIGEKRTIESYTDKTNNYMTELELDNDKIKLL